MSNLELITTIISIVVTLIGSVLGYLAKKNDKAKKYYEAFIEVESKVKEFCIAAEGIYKSGDQKKKYVIASINKYLNDNDIKVENEQIEQIIESVILVSKNINNKGQSS